MISCRKAILRTNSKGLIDICQPTVNNICIKDIATGLSNICRFSGQCDIFYPVAQHSVFVSYLCKACPLGGLLHDGTEAYLNDIVSSLKKLLPLYKKIELNFQSAIIKKFKLKKNFEAIVKPFDVAALEIEKKSLFSLDKAEIGVKIVPWSPKKAKRVFLERYYELVGQTV